MEFKENYGILEFRKNLKEISEEFRNTTTNATKIHVGKTKQEKEKVSGAVREAIKNSNKLRTNRLSTERNGLMSAKKRELPLIIPKKRPDVVR